MHRMGRISIKSKGGLGFIFHIYDYAPKVMKNWEPLVLGPALAMDSSRGFVCLTRKFSSGNLVP